MFALIFQNKVVQIETKPFEVTDGFKWVETNDAIEYGSHYDGEKFIAPEIPAKKEEEPNKVHCLIDALAKTTLGTMTKIEFEKEYDKFKDDLIIPSKDNIDA